MQITQDKKRNLFIKSYGCQMNEYDSERMIEILEKHNYSSVDEPNQADLIILNTCHIREKAAEKIYSELGRLKKINLNSERDIKVAVAGCVGQAEGHEIIKRSPIVDLVFGPLTYHQLPEMLEEIESKPGSPNKKLVNIDVPDEDKFLELKGSRKNLKSISSLLSIQEGCDKFCSFCVVPYTRGVEISRPAKQIISEAKELIGIGAKEIILLGQNVNAYSYKNYKLSNLILEIEKLSKVKRIRYTTSHPNDMTADLIEIYKNSKKLMPLIHLPVQSGSNKILKFMNRKHSINEYLRIFDKLKQINSNIEFSSDFIIGYPGEDDQDFRDTLNLIKRVNFINSYSFIFSPRPGTVAENLKLIDRKISIERLKKIQNLLSENQNRTHKSLENQTMDVLVENLTDDKTRTFGRSEHMIPVIFNGKKDDIGKIVKVKITQSTRNSLFGELINISNKKVA